MSSFDLEVGHTVSHFRMGKKLGEGGMGAVFLAEDLTLSRRVAIKFMSRALLVQQGNAEIREDLEKRFIREARSAAAINHPNLAQIYEANFESDNWYIAMELIDGASLYDHVVEEKKTFSAEEIISICRQTVCGLDFAWGNYKIIHWDVKPHNIMLTKNNLVKIVDLGLAKPIANGDEESELSDLTGAGTPIGTPQYMAPEQATGQKDIDFLVDIFALGATMYEVCCGEKAFSGSTAPMIYMSQIQKKYTPLKQLRPNLPDQLITLIDTMLEPKPEDRISSYPAVLDVLEKISTASQNDDMAKTVLTSDKTVAGHLSGKTIGIDQQTIYYSADKLIKKRYRILKPIGKSRAGMLYHCLDTQLGVECTVKSIFPSREYPEHEMPRIKDNLQRLMGLSHPNLINIRDLQQEEDSGELFVVMELLSGRDLREYSHRLKNEYKNVTVETILPVIKLIATALDNIDKTFNIIHHDLIPENIYLTENDTQVKFIDYGITYPSLDDQQLALDELHLLPLASPDYMPPELWKRQPASKQADQYCLAVIVYEILANKLPFWLKDSLPDDDGNIKADTPRPEQQLKYLFDRVTTHTPDIIPLLKRHENAALLKALSKNPKDRFHSCDEFVRALANSGGLGLGVKLVSYQ